ncbi:MAG: hypothetical protein AAF616_12450, partial [Bacteroidota bacterium]
MRLPHIIILVAFAYQSTSQKLVIEKSIDLSTEPGNSKDVLTIVERDSAFSYVFFDDFEFKMIKFNDHFEELEQYSTKRSDSFYSTYEGFSEKDGYYHLYFTSSKRKNFYVHSINPAEKVAQSKKIELSLKQEKYLGSVSYLGDWFLMSMVKNSSTLKLYHFEGDRLKKEHTLDFSNGMFFNVNRKIVSLDKVVSGAAKKVYSDEDLSISSVHEETKMYLYVSKW